MPTRLSLFFALIVLILTACSSAATLSSQEEVGQAVFIAQCGSCHSIVADKVIVGPSLAGVASRAGNRVEGQDARTYLYTSLLEPGRYLVDGYSALMPFNIGKELTDEELDAVVAYLLTLK